MHASLIPRRSSRPTPPPRSRTTQRLSLAVAFGFGLVCAPTQGQTIQNDLRTLATHEGRSPGSKGHAAAAEYLRDRFTALGLSPAMIDPQGRPTFDHVLDAVAPPAVERAQLTYFPPDEAEPITMPAIAHWASGPGSFAGPGVFTGYSIVSGPSGYLSFATANDFTDAVALTFKLEPMDSQGESLWTNGGGWSFRASAMPKVAALARRSAAAVVLVTPPGAVDAESAEPPRDPTNDFRFEIPVVMIEPEDADRFLTLADPQGRSIGDLRSLADAAPVIEQLQGEFQIELETSDAAGPVANVVARLPGKGDLADEDVLLIAYYDGPADLPAANKNASGTAGLLHAAGVLRRAFEVELPSVDHARSIVFLALGNGTTGAEGLEAYLEATSSEASGTPAVAILLDTVGYSERAQLSVVGVNSGEGLRDWLKPIFARSYFEIDASPIRRSWGSLLNAPFDAGIPSLLLTTGFTREINTPADNADFVDPETIAASAELAAEIALEMAMRPQRFETDRGAANIRQPDRPQRPVRLGVQPVFNDDEPGILIQRVFDDTAAAEAGLREGDRITQWNGEEVIETDDFVMRLGLTRPGDSVTFTVIREGEPVQVEVKFPASDD